MLYKKIACNHPDQTTFYTYSASRNSLIDYLSIAYKHWGHYSSDKHKLYDLYAKQPDYNGSKPSPVNTQKIHPFMMFLHSIHKNEKENWAVGSQKFNTANRALIKAGKKPTEQNLFWYYLKLTVPPVTIYRDDFFGFVNQHKSVIHKRKRGLQIQDINFRVYVNLKLTLETMQTVLSSLLTNIKDNPANINSFGMDRSYSVYDAMKKLGKKPALFKAFVEAVDEELDRNGISTNNPHLAAPESAINSDDEDALTQPY